jgi:hypothetical protein
MDARVRCILGELRVPASVPAVLKALEGSRRRRAHVAARALGRMKLQATDEVLVALPAGTSR